MAKVNRIGCHQQPGSQVIFGLMWITLFPLTHVQQHFTRELCVLRTPIFQCAKRKICCWPFVMQYFFWSTIISTHTMRSKYIFFYFLRANSICAAAWASRNCLRRKVCPIYIFFELDMYDVAVIQDHLLMLIVGCCLWRWDSKAVSCCVVREWLNGNRKQIQWMITVWPDSKSTEKRMKCNYFHRKWNKSESTYSFDAAHINIIFSCQSSSISHDCVETVSLFTIYRAFFPFKRKMDQTSLDKLMLVCCAAKSSFTMSNPL